MATAWPHSHDRVLVEADCSGGVFGARYDIPVEPGSADLVSQARRGRFDAGVDISQFARHVKTSGIGGTELWVVPSPLASHEALDVWRAMATPAAEAMLYDDRLWLVDCGRVWHRSPVEPVLAVAPLSIIVSDGSMPSLLVLKARVDSLPNRSAILVVGEMRYTTDDLLTFTGADYVWNVPHVRSLDTLAAEFATGGRARRSKAWRTALTITHTLAPDFQSAFTPSPQTVPGNPATPPPPPGSAPLPDTPAPTGPPTVPPPRDALRKPVGPPPPDTVRKPVGPPTGLTPSPSPEGEQHLSAVDDLADGDGPTGGEHHEVEAR